MVVGEACRGVGGRILLLNVAHVPVSNSSKEREKNKKTGDKIIGFKKKEKAVGDMKPWFHPKIHFLPPFSIKKSKKITYHGPFAGLQLKKEINKALMWFILDL